MNDKQQEGMQGGRGDEVQKKKIRRGRKRGGSGEKEIATFVF